MRTAEEAGRGTTASAVCLEQIYYEGWKESMDKVEIKRYVLEVMEERENEIRNQEEQARLAKLAKDVPSYNFMLTLSIIFFLIGIMMFIVVYNNWELSSMPIANRFLMDAMKYSSIVSIVIGLICSILAFYAKPNR